MAKVIIWTRPDGGISVTYPRAAQLPGETETDYLNRIAGKAQLDGAIPMTWIHAADLETSSLPLDRDFRDAWVFNAGAVTHDIAKARVVHQARIDARNDKRLRELHLETIKAEGDAPRLARAQADLQAARATANAVAAQIQAAQTIQALKVITPL